jgi:formate dehydrogenase subunit gamma
MTASEDLKRLAGLIEPFVGRTGGLLSALRAVQEKIGFLPSETEAAAATAFNLTRAEVKGVISFYADFHREPRGRAVVRLCAAESCQAQGARALEAAVERRLAVKMGATAASGAATLERVYCLGLCSVGPAAMVGGRLFGRASAERIAAAAAQCEESA